MVSYMSFTDGIGGFAGPAGVVDTAGPDTAGVDAGAGGVDAGGVTVGGVAAGGVDAAAGVDASWPILEAVAANHLNARIPM